MINPTEDRGQMLHALVANLGDDLIGGAAASPLSV